MYLHTYSLPALCAYKFMHKCIPTTVTVAVPLVNIMGGDTLICTAQ